MARRLLIPLIILQALTHLFWLSTSVHSGQVAIPWLMNNGMRLFDDILEQHAPGSSLLAAAAQRALPLADPALLTKLLNTALVIALTLLITLLAKRLANSAAAGILAALVWAWWEPVYGNVMLYFDSLLALCLSAAMLVYFADSERPSMRRVIVIGLLMGAATLFKQQAWLALGLMLLWLILVERRRETALVFVGAALLLPLLQWIWLLAQGSLSSYIYWNWTFNLSGLMDGAPLDGDLVRKLLLGNLLIFPFALLAWREARRQTLLVLIWLASLSVLYPRFGEIHAMGHLPLTAVMSGVVLAKVWPALKNWRSRDMTNIMLAGLAFGIGLGWLWTGAASYLHLPLGPGATLGYDEFSQLAAELNGRKTTGDTLFVLPETDSSPQLHTLTDMPPPGVWVKGWHWYFRGEGVLNRLKDEWAEEAPTWIVVFPDLILNREIGIGDLLAIVAERYQLVAEVDGIYGHGPAEIYTLKISPE